MKTGEKGAREARCTQAGSCREEERHNVHKLGGAVEKRSIEYTGGKCRGDGRHSVPYIKILPPLVSPGSHQQGNTDTPPPHYRHYRHTVMSEQVVNTLCFMEAS
ncbi:hypothetical protein E2C01_020140 [Portunus trituberculatus]|uniref:Uncharacterized protein n=1 Tax=Portunus trituberculatus TaxID=210409 RepID=A0A5B7E0Q6_PORTR|nr:hypothetical protein [Portunus trituberculatus]